MIIIDIETKKLYEINPTRAGENYMTCPVCSATRKKKRDKCFVWNADKNVGHCCHCEAKFALYNSLKSAPQKEYFVPQWKNKTQLTDKAVKYFEGRMISQGTLRALKIYSDREYMPQFGKEVEVMCFPYFVGDKLVNIKYRGAQKSFKMVKDAELVFYNFNCIQDSKELIICEGEFDCLTFIDAGFKNCVSVPNGAHAKDLTYLDNYVEQLEHIEKFYIAADFDDAGLQLRNELIRRLGAEKCAIVTYEGYKDANDLMKSAGGLAIRRIIQNAQEVPEKGVIDMESQYDNIYSMWQKGLPKGFGVGIPELDENIRWSTSHLAVWTGIPSHGKSEMLDFIVSKLAVRYGWKTVFFSPENYPLEVHYSKISEKITGRKFDKNHLTEEEFNAAFDFISDHFYWLEPYEDTTVESILLRTKYHVRKYGIKQLVIDPFNCLEHTKHKEESGSEYIGRFLDELERFARKYDILIHLVAHPTKLESLGGRKRSYAPPTLYDISGSANFYNKADYGITIFREFDPSATHFIVTKMRFKNFGATADVELKYNYNNGRYEEPEHDVNDFDNSNWLVENQEPKPDPYTIVDDGEVPF